MNRQNNLIEAVKPITPVVPIKLANKPVKTSLLKNKLKATYDRPAPPVIKKKILLGVYDWEAKMIEEIQTTYKDVCNKDLSTTDVLRIALREHLSKMQKQIHWYKNKYANHSK